MDRHNPQKRSPFTRTLALILAVSAMVFGAAIADARFVYRWSRDHAPFKRDILLEEVGSAGLYLLSDLAAGVTGEVLHVDGGYNKTGIPSPKRMTGGEE